MNRPRLLHASWLPLLLLTGLAAPAGLAQPAPVLRPQTVAPLSCLALVILPFGTMKPWPS